MDDTVKETEGNGKDLYWQKLDKRVVSWWKIQTSIGFLIFFFIILTGGTALWLLTPFPGAIFLLVVLAAAGLFCLNFFWLPEKRFQTWSYRLTDSILEFRSGIIFKKSVMIPLSRLQHADLIRGPIEQRLGISSLVIHTAGTKAASHTISGLEAETAGRLRDDLIASAKLKLK